jgi:hypothetical protein
MPFFQMNGLTNSIGGFNDDHASENGKLGSSQLLMCTAGLIKLHGVNRWQQLLTLK